MIFTVCIPPTPPTTSDKVQVDTCRSFSDFNHMEQWLKEKGIYMGKLPCTAWKS